MGKKFVGRPVGVLCISAILVSSVANAFADYPEIVAPEIDANAATAAATEADAEFAARALEEAAVHFDSLSDEQAATEIEQDAHSLQSRADELVKTNQVSPTAPVVQASEVTAATAQEIARTKTAGLARRMSLRLRKLAQLVGKSLGYGGQGVAMATVAPLFTGMGFGIGIAVGEQVPAKQPGRAYAYIGAGTGVISTLIAETRLLNALAPVTSYVLPVSFGVLAANTLVCETKGKDSDYCHDIDGMNRWATETAGLTGKKGGAKVRRAIRRLFDKHD